MSGSVIFHYRQFKSESCAAIRIILSPDPASMFFDDGFAKGQAYAKTGGLCCEKWLKYC